ncbi:hypothetical protein ACH3XW_4960 [Acanthocheilonema viteae]
MDDLKEIHRRNGSQGHKAHCPNKSSHCPNLPLVPLFAVHSTSPVSICSYLPTFSSPRFILRSTPPMTLPLLISSKNRPVAGIDGQSYGPFYLVSSIK